LSSSSSSQTQRRQNTQKNKNKKPREWEGAYLQAFVMPFHFWLSHLPFCFKCFFLTSFSSQEKKKKPRNKKEM